MLNFEKVLSVVVHFPYKDIFTIVGILFLPIFVICFIYLIIISPIICKFYIVPGIEKKMGKKLGYSPILSLAPFGRYIDRQIEISRYILNRYRAWKKNGETGVPFGYDSFALKKIGYTIDKISRGEIIFSYLVRISFYLGLIAFLFGYIAATLNNSK